MRCTALLELPSRRCELAMGRRHRAAARVFGRAPFAQARHAGRRRGRWGFVIYHEFDMILGNRLPALGLLVLVFATGCGPGTSSVSGTVTYDGKPVCSGTVMLLADGASPLYAELKDDGTFAL